MNIVPDYIAPLVAYRTWAVQANGLLSGLAAAQPWVPRRPMVAVCNGHDMTSHASLSAHFVDGVWHDAPADGCSCGIYALKENPEYKSWHTDIRPSGFAIGEAWLWGRIIEHELGFKAQYAYPKTLTVYGTPELAALVASVYGIEAEQKDKPKDYQSDWYSLGRFYFSPAMKLQPLQNPYLSYGVVSAWEEETPAAPQMPVTTLQGVKERNQQKALQAAQRHRERLTKQRRGWSEQPWI